MIDSDTLARLISRQEAEVEAARSALEQAEAALAWLREGEAFSSGAAPARRPHTPPVVEPPPSKANGKPPGTNGERLLRVLAERGPMSGPDARKLARIPSGSIGAVMDELERAGKIIRKKKGRVNLLMLPNQGIGSEFNVEGSLAGKVLAALPASVDSLRARFGDEAISELDAMREEGLAAPSADGNWSQV